MKFSKSVFILAAIGLMISGCTLSRTIFWNLPDVIDQKRFPSETITHATKAFQFAESNTKNDFGKTIRVMKDRWSVNATSLDEFLEHSPTLAFIIIINDTILYERYFKGWRPEKPVTSFSVAKSFVGMLTGIAIQEGYIKSAEEPIWKYLPEVDSNMFRYVKIRHLLDQTSGIRFPANSWLYYTKHLELLPKKLKIRRPPGQLFRYESGNTELLGWIVERATGKSLAQYMTEKIWSKIGTSQDAYWSKDRKDGHIKSYCCINALAKDFAMFGRLLLNKGKWNQEQVISEWWWKNSMERTTFDGASVHYRNQLWSENVGNPNVFAVGLYGQYIYTCPSKNTIILKFSPKNFTHHPYWSSIFDSILQQL